MSVLRVLIVDDEPLAARNVALLVERDTACEVVGECTSGVDAPDAVRKLRPDVLFLDVQMPERDGFDVLELLGADAPAAVVFVTAYDRYALKAFEAGALDYLLKPFDTARFEKALERAKATAMRGRDEPKKVQRLAVKSAGQVMFVNVAEIDWIEAADYYAALHVGPRTYLLRRTLNELENDLREGTFARIHRSTMVNIERVQAIEPGEDGEATVVLQGGTSLRVSRSYRRALQERLGLKS